MTGGDEDHRFHDVDFGLRQTRRSVLAAVLLSVWLACRLPLADSLLSLALLRGRPTIGRNYLFAIAVHASKQNDVTAGS